MGKIKNRHTNSTEALVKAMASIPESRRCILKTIALNQGLTANEIHYELAALGIDKPINRITPRILELRNQGLLKVGESRKDHYTGFKAMTYITTAKANSMVKKGAK